MTYQTPHLGTITVDEESAIEFRRGLPGFEQCRRFVPLLNPACPALVFLQSLDLLDLCFLAMPVRSVRPDYELAIASEDLEELGFTGDAHPVLGEDVVALAILSASERQNPTANLRSPVLIHMRTCHAVQAIREDQRYGCREPLLAEDVVCS